MKVDYPVTLSVSGDTPLQNSYIRNISTIGAFIETNLRLKEGEKVAFTLGSERVVNGIVQRRQRKPPKGVGVTFLQTIAQWEILGQHPMGRDRL